jgi:predicted enzyme related to lactoylglutathione lyase
LDTSTLGAGTVQAMKQLGAVHCAKRGGVVECGTQRPSWLPYVSVPDVTAATNHAQQLGAAVLLTPREGPAGWRSVVVAPDAGELAFWQSKA